MEHMRHVLQHQTLQKWKLCLMHTLFECFESEKSSIEAPYIACLSQRVFPEYGSPRRQTSLLLIEDEQDDNDTPYD
ncbi:unnamed protein product [Arabidopsis thaliana]|nr:unnamed protein product [Arabidopsis thaliana]